MRGMLCGGFVFVLGLTVVVRNPRTRPFAAIFVGLAVLVLLIAVK